MLSSAPSESQEENENESGFATNTEKYMTDSDEKILKRCKYLIRILIIRRLYT